MEIAKTINGEEAVITLKGWLDTQAAPELHEVLDTLEPEVKKLVLDFSDLEYISSSGVREMVSAYKKMNGALVIRNVSDGIMNIFKATGIDKRVTFE